MVESKRRKGHSFILSISIFILVFSVVIPMFNHTVSASQNWYNSDWSYRKLITINSSKVAAQLSNFPVLVYRSSDTSLADDTKCQNDGDDICFVKYSDNTTKLNHEIESFNGATGALNAWVNITRLSSSTNTKIWMYYGHADVTSQQNKYGTWNSNCVMVLHLGETAGVYADSTSNKNNGTWVKGGSSTRTGTPKIGDSCPSFDGIGNNDYIKVNDNPTLNFTTTFTWEGWVKSASVGAEGNLISKNLVGTGNGWDIEHYYTSSPARVLAQNGEGGTTLRYSTTAFVLNTWQYRACSFDDTNVYFNYNGAADGSSSFVLTNAVNKKLYIGIAYPATTYLYEFNGQLDEFRLSKNQRNTSWLTTSYNTEANPTTFHFFGTEQGYNPAPTLTLKSVYPTTGVASYTAFQFNVTWTDGNGDDPVDGYLKANISRSGWYVNASMTWISGSNTTGAVYSYSTTLTAGSYSYIFYAYDGLSHIGTTTVNNPTVSSQSISITIYQGTTPVWFNITSPGHYTQANVSGSGTGGSGTLQIENAGNVPINLTIQSNTSLQTGCTMKWDTDSNPVGAHPITTSPVSFAVAVAASSTKNLWLWMDFYQVSPATGTRHLEIISIADVP
jgi:hypothetical protein